MQHKNTEIRLLAFTTQFLDRGFHILLQFPDCVFQRRARVVDLIDDEHVLANQIRHLERRQVEPLCACDFCAGRLDVFVCGCGEGFVEGEADGLDGDVGAVFALEEGSG